MALGSVHLPGTGIQVSELGFGTWRFGKQTPDGDYEIDHSTAQHLLDRYADAGGRLIDTANVYGDGRAEEWIGEWLADRDRSQFILASKIYWPTRDDGPNSSGLNRGHLRAQLDAILCRLDTDYLDILYIHRWDDTTPMAEFMRTLTQFVDEGRVHYLGASCLEPNSWQVARANAVGDAQGWVPFSVTQPRYNLVNREIEGTNISICVADLELGVMPWSPLALGFLTGKYSRTATSPK